MVVANELATELFNLSAQPQFCLNLNRCGVHTSWNDGDLITQTHRERHCPSSVGGQRFLSPAELGTCNCGPWINLVICAFGSAVLLGCTLLSYGITAHYPGYFHGCWFDQALSCSMRRCWSWIFPSNRKRGAHRFAVLWE